MGGPLPAEHGSYRELTFVARLEVLLRVSRRDANQLCVHKLRTENFVSFAIGFNGFERNLLITEMSKSVQESSVEVWEDCLGHANSASVNERFIDGLALKNSQSRKTTTPEPA